MHRLRSAFAAVPVLASLACGGGGVAPGGPNTPSSPSSPSSPEGACGALPRARKGPPSDSAPDPVVLAETANNPDSAGTTLVFLSVEEDACRSLQPAAGTFGINGAFQGSALVVVFRLPEPSSPISWTVTFPDGTPGTYTLTDRVRGGNVVSHDRDPSVPPVAGMVYRGALRLDLRQFVEKGRLRPGATITVRYADRQAQVRYAGS